MNDKYYVGQIVRVNQTPSDPLINKSVGVIVEVYGNFVTVKTADGQLYDCFESQISDPLLGL
jgi:hypothetical protein